MVTPAPISTGSDRAEAPVVRPPRIPRWLGVVLPAAILGGLGQVVLQAVNQSWLPLVLLIGGSAALGLLTGFAARRSLPHRSNLLRWVVAMGGLTVGLLAAGIVSGGEVGLGPLLPPVPHFRWAELVQLGAAGLAAWLAVRAFARPEPPLPAEPPLAPGQANWGFAYHPTIHDTQPIRARRGAPQRPATSRARPAASTAGPAPRSEIPRPDPALRKGFRRLRAEIARAVAWRPGLGDRLARRKPSPIRFTGTGEDRCPYCLDVVAENDRRGVTTCPVCHTRHHAECWAVTGTCQMPHLYQGQATRTGAAR